MPKHNRQDAKDAKTIEFERGAGEEAARATPGIDEDEVDGLAEIPVGRITDQSRPRIRISPDNHATIPNPNYAQCIQPM